MLGLPCDGSCRCSSPTWRGWRLWPWAPRSSLRPLGSFQRRRTGGGWMSGSGCAGVLGETASLREVASGYEGRADEGRASWDQSQRASSRSRAGIYKQSRPHQPQPETASVRTSNPPSGVSLGPAGTPDAPLQAHFHPPAFRGGATTDNSQSCTAQALAHSPAPRLSQAPTLWVHPLLQTPSYSLSPSDRASARPPPADYPTASSFPAFHPMPSPPPPFSPH